MFIEREGNDIVIPIDVVKDWEMAYGRKDIAKTLPIIQGTVEAIDNLLSTHSLRQSDIPRQFSVRIRNQNFFCTDLGRFVQAAILNGHNIDPEKFFKDSGADWDKGKEFIVKVTQTSFVDLKDSYNNRLVYMGVSGPGFSLSVAKNTTELLKLLY